MELNSLDSTCCAHPPCLLAKGSSVEEQSLQLYGPRLFAKLGGRKASSVRVVVVQHNCLICDRVAAPEHGRVR
jgi:hypothetical protein